MDELIWIHLMIGPFMFVLCLLFKKMPPKKINFWYGYRTQRSMKSEEAWNYANAYSSTGLVRVSIVTLLFQLSLYFLLKSVMVILLSVGVLLIGIVVVMIQTERHLKSKGF